MTEQTTQISWPGWKTNRLIGRGSFGAVYEIEREVFGDVEKAALKMISIPQNASDVEDMFGDGFTEEDITETFQSHLQSIVAEYSLMKKMNGCANIVNCDDVRYIQHEDGFGWDIYIKMELLTPLIKALPNDIPEEMTVKLAKDMCAALQICKKHGVIHRDIKPQNIFVSPYGDYKLGDFGIAKTVEKTMGGTKIGTYRYMAPEVYNNQPYNCTADIYSLGLVLYWMLNEKRMPFLPMPPAKVTAEMESETRLWRFQGKELPPPAHGSENLKRIILKACAFDPKDRYQDADAMLADLNNLSGGAVPVPPHVHSYSAAVTSPTCTEKGYTTYTCECGHSYQGDETPALGHDFGGWNVTRQATEEAGGEERRACSRCGHAETRGVPKLPKVITPTEQPKKKKPIIPIIAGVAAVLAAALLLPGMIGGKEPAETKPSMQGTTNSPKETVSSTKETTIPPGETLPVQKEWSEWMDKLPGYVTKENYDIREKTMYSSQQLETTTSTTSKKLDGWELYDTITTVGDYGPWSDWAQSEVSGSDTRKVEKATFYSYRNKETTTSSASTKSGWELYDTTYAWSDYGEWSNWNSDQVSSSDSREVQTKTQYRYSDCDRKSSYSESMSGYTLVSSEWEQTGSGSTRYVSSWPNGFNSGHGLYSDYNKSPKSSSESNTEKTEITSDYVCGYIYYHWCRGTYGNGPINRKSSSYKTGDLTSFHAFYSATSPGGLEQPSDHDGSYRYENGSCCKDSYWYYCVPVYEQNYATYQKVFYYEKWSEPSAWSDSAVEATDTRSVETRTLYRYRDREQIPTYYFYRWSDWTNWTQEAVSGSESREVKTALFYRYQDKITGKTYCFRRWSGWSTYQDEKITPSDTVRVETKTVYQFKSKNS